MTKTPSYESASAWKKFAERREQLSPTEEQLLDSQFDECSKTLDRVRKELHKYPNVIGTGVSMKFKSGEVLDQPCIVIHVTKKIPNMREGVVPAFIDGWPTDVIEMDIPRAQGTFIEPECPLQPGNSIKHIALPETSLGGTLGCLVRDLSPESKSHTLHDKSPFSDILLLSNNHVIANDNIAKPGDPIFHHFTRPHHSAYLTRWINIEKPPHVNEVDAAVAKPIVPVDPDILEIGIPKGIRNPAVGDSVKMTGAMSGKTSGTVEAIDEEVSVDTKSHLGIVKYSHCIITSEMSKGGDSGSLLLDDIGPPSSPKNNNGVGLHFAGSNRGCNLNLRRVLNLLNVDLVTTSNWTLPA